MSSQWKDYHDQLLTSIMNLRGRVVTCVCKTCCIPCIYKGKSQMTQLSYYLTSLPQGNVSSTYRIRAVNDGVWKCKLPRSFPSDPNEEPGLRNIVLRPRLNIKHLSWLQVVSSEYVRVWDGWKEVVRELTILVPQRQRMTFVLRSFCFVLFCVLACACFYQRGDKFGKIKGRHRLVQEKKNEIEYNLHQGFRGLLFLIWNGSPALQKVGVENCGNYFGNSLNYLIIVSVSISIRLQRPNHNLLPG